MTAAMVPFEAAIEDASRGNPKLRQASFKKEGRFPVVDQGQKPVAGYADDAALLCRVPGPVIVFGDHTRAFKYVDFPFVIGADGVKVLRAREGWDPKYVYHYLRSRNIPSAGYSRHFKFLREIEVPHPPLDEQRRIAAFLDQAEAVRTKRRQTVVLTEDMAQSIFREMFGDPVANTRGLPSRVLSGWVDSSAPITYGILKPGPDRADGVPYVRVVDIQGGVIVAHRVRRTSSEIDAGYSRSRLVEGDLVISIRGHVGRLGIVPAELHGANITQDSARIRVSPVAREYIAAALTTSHMKRWMTQRTKGAAVQGINLGDLRLAPVPVPPPAEMKIFAARTQMVRHLASAAHRHLLEAEGLFDSLQQRAFAADWGQCPGHGSEPYRRASENT